MATPKLARDAVAQASIGNGSGAATGSPAETGHSTFRASKLTSPSGGMGGKRARPSLQSFDRF